MRNEREASGYRMSPHNKLSDDDRRLLILDAYERAKESGHYFDYTKKAREIIYGR